MPEPWSKEKRAKIKDKIDQESKRTARRLGAEGCLIIAFFRDGDYIHAQDGGSTLVGMSYLDTYRRMASMHEIMVESGGEDVSLN